MDRAAKWRSNIAAAQRGQLVQRVLVDGWSPAKVSATYNVHERQVTALVAAYRRRGMLALRSEASPQGILQRARSLCDAMARMFPRLFQRAQTGTGRREPGHCVELARYDDDARRHR